MTSIKIKRPIVISVLCHKGGVAKTTTAVALADSLAADHPSAKVLILDCDEQANVKTLFGIKATEAERGIASILIENTPPSKVKITVRPQIDVILSGGRMMRDFEKTFSTSADSERLLSRMMKPFDEDYDYVIIDSPPALSLISANIAMYADYCVIPCTTDLLSVVGVKNTMFFLENLRNHYRAKNLSPCNVLGVVPTMYDQRRNLDMTILDDLQRMADADLMSGGIVFDPIRVDSKIKTAQVKRKLISEVFPKSKAREDYRKLASDIRALVTNTADVPLQTFVQAPLSPSPAREMAL
ncbi:ParA family protein [Bdellovibrionota bacterium FG-2]